MRGYIVFMRGCYSFKLIKFKKFSGFKKNRNYKLNLELEKVEFPLWLRS